MEILSDFIFIVCVFFMPLVLGYAEHVDVPSAVTALDTRRIKYASRVETTPSASKSLGLLLRAQGGFGAINVEINTRLAKKG